ncbi:MAG: tetratricopeptide repeat protein [bacterium]|nr:tetratricopeptide repeat protein [bacterium]
MPVLLPVSLLLGSLGSLVFVISRRFRMVKKTLLLQRELAQEQKKEDRAHKKSKRMKERAIEELKRSSEQKHKALRNLGAINELMKKVDHDLMAGDEEVALQTLIQIISLDPNHRKANELLAKLYLNSGQNKKAELIYKRLIELYPFDPTYYSNLARSYYNRQQFQAATQCYEEALRLDKNNPLHSVNLGHLYSTRKDFSSALAYYMQAHRLNVRDIQLMFIIVEVCLHNTNPITAREYLHKILDYEPYNQQAKTMLGEVLRDLKELA